MLFLFALTIVIPIVSPALENCNRDIDCMLGENCWHGLCQCTAFTDNEHFGCTQPGYGCKHYEDKPNECVPSPNLQPHTSISCNLLFPSDCISNDCHFVSFPMNGKCECNYRSDCDILSYCDKTSKINECQQLGFFFSFEF